MSGERGQHPAPSRRPTPTPVSSLPTTPPPHPDPSASPSIFAINHALPEWLPPIVAGHRLDVWTFDAIRAIAKRIEALEATQ